MEQIQHTKLHVLKVNRQWRRKALRRANKTKAERSTLNPLRLKYRNLFVHHQNMYICTQSEDMHVSRSTEKTNCVSLLDMHVTRTTERNRNCMSLLGMHLMRPTELNGLIKNALVINTVKTEEIIFSIPNCQLPLVKIS